MKCPQYFICYREVCIHFSDGTGRTHALLGGFCTGRIFYGEGSFQGVNFSGEIR